MSLPSVPTEEELQELFKKTFSKGLTEGYINVLDYVLPKRYFEFEKRIKEFKVLDTDVWICGFPKTGTTWISEIAWLIAKDFDYEGAKVPDYKRTRMLEFTMLFDKEMQKNLGNEFYAINSIAHAATQEEPRTIKSHLPFPLLPEEITKGTRKPRIICTARNPMDTCISYYHQCKNYESFTGTVDEFCSLFLYNKVNYTSYASHVLSFWNQRHNSNVLFVTYEEMKKDLPAVINNVAKFLGKKVTSADVKRLQEHVSFDSMKKNPAVNKEHVNQNLSTIANANITPFIRSGKSGGYQSVMSAEMIQQFRYWMGKRFEGSGLNLLEH